MTEEIESIRSVGALTSADLSPSHESPVPSPSPTAARAPVPDADTKVSPSSRADSAEPPSLHTAVEQLNARLAGSDRVLVLRVDAGTGLTIAEIKNASTGQVLRQMPSDDVVRLAELISSLSGGKSLLDLIA
jgi:flagellar protein FlaG